MIKDLALRGMRDFFPAKDAEIIREFARHIQLGGVLVGYEEGVPVAFCIIYWPTSALEIPQVLHFYSEGSRATTRKLLGSMMDKIKQKGYNKFRAINGSGADDAIWTRAFSYEGWEIKPVKTVFEFEAVK